MYFIIREWKIPRDNKNNRTQILNLTANIKYCYKKNSLYQMMSINDITIPLEDW